MSIADKITRLQTAKTNIASAIATKGGTVTSGDGFEDFATDIATIPSGSATLQSKTLTLGASAPSSVSPDSGYDGLSSVPVTIDSTVIKAENIAQGTTILGIAGTHSGGGGGSISNGIVYDVVDANGYVQEATIYGPILPPYAFYYSQVTGRVNKITIKDTISYSEITIIPSGNCTLDIYFEEIPVTLSSNVFKNTTSSNINIYVPWAEGEVANAPWGATRATIHYDYTGV